jgi:hypothetical protein
MLHIACSSALLKPDQCDLPQLHFGGSHFPARPKTELFLSGATSSRHRCDAHFGTATVTVVTMTCMTMVVPITP